MWCTSVHRLSACNKISLFGGKIEVVQNMEILQVSIQLVMVLILSGCGEGGGDVVY